MIFILTSIYILLIHLISIILKLCIFILSVDYCTNNVTLRIVVFYYDILYLHSIKHYLYSNKLALLDSRLLSFFKLNIP